MADVIQIADVKSMSVNDVKARIDIVKKLKTIMDDGVHYGSIAGSKPCLFKAGAEVLLLKTLFLHVIPFLNFLKKIFFHSIFWKMPMLSFDKSRRKNGN